MALGKKPVESSVGNEERKCRIPGFPPFSTMFSSLSKKNCTIGATLKLSTANSFNFYCKFFNFVYYPLKKKLDFNFMVTFSFLSANAFNLDQFKILSFGNELTATFIIR